LAEAPGIENLENTFKLLIARHESLRTSFHTIDGETVQKIHDQVEFSMEHGAWSMEGRDFVRPFDLSRAPLLRVEMIKTKEHKHLLMVDMHHIISDGTSHEILVRDFTALYEGKALAPLHLQYKDFSQWQNKEKQKDYLKQQEAYWLSRFEGGVPELNIPTDYARPREQSFEGSLLEDEISCDTHQLKTIAVENNATLFMALLAIFNIFLAKISGREDVVVGTPIAGRNHADLQQVMGMFVNTLALRNQPEREKTFTGFLKEVKESTLQAFNNQDYQFEDLVDKVVGKRDRHNPIFDVVFQLQESDWDPDEYQLETRTAKFDLILSIVIAKKLFFSFEYSTKLFKKKTIEIFARSFKEIVLSVLKDKNIKLKDIEVTSNLSDSRLGVLEEELTNLEF
jgi:tyrocidine synthetase-3